MKVETLYVPNVVLRVHSLTVRHRELIMLLNEMPPGARLRSVDIMIDEKDPYKRYVNVDINSSLSVSEEIFPK
jgi:hypothetical protein